MFAMNAFTVISTDLLTPLGAYLRLREGGRASFLLESVEKGRLGRHSFVGAARGWSLRRGGDAAVSRSSATSATTTPPGSSRPCRVPDEGRDLPESRFVVADTLVRFDHGLGMAEVLCGDPDVGRRAARRAATFAGARRAAHALRLDPPAALAPRVRARGRARRRSTSARATPSRSCSRSGPSGRPRRARSSSTARSGASTRRRTCSCSSSTGSRWSAPRRRRSSRPRAGAPR